MTLADGRVIEHAALVGADPKSDLAVVKIEASDLVPAKWGDSATLSKGDWILAFGSPFGYIGSMTHGIVSALDSEPEPSASLASPFPGSPLLGCHDGDGRLFSRAAPGVSRLL